MAIGAVLSQFQDSLTKLERNYSTIERVGAVREFYPYLYGFQFKLVTDHDPLTSLKNLKDVGDGCYTFNNSTSLARIIAMLMPCPDCPFLAISLQLANDLSTNKGSTASR